MHATTREGDLQERSRAPAACEVYRGAHRTCDVRHSSRDVARLTRMRKLFDVLDRPCLPIARAAGARQIGSTDSASDLADVLSRHTRVPGSPGWMMPRAAQRSVG